MGMIGYQDKTAKVCMMEVLRCTTEEFRLSWLSKRAGVAESTGRKAGCELEADRYIGRSTRAGWWKVVNRPSQQDIDDEIAGRAKRESKRADYIHRKSSEDLINKAIASRPLWVVAFEGSINGESE